MDAKEVISDDAIERRKAQFIKAAPLSGRFWRPCRPFAGISFEVVGDPSKDDKVGANVLIDELLDRQIGHCSVEL